MQNLCHLFYPNATRIIPAVISPIPAALIAETVSCRKTTAAVAAKTTLNLSTGATWETLPYFNAVK